MIFNENGLDVILIALNARNYSANKYMILNTKVILYKHWTE